jgi:hypothetical protein
VTLPALPKQSQPIAGSGGIVTTSWYDFLARRDAALSGDTAELSAQVAALSEQVANLEVGEVIGLYSVSVSGQLSDGQAYVQLTGDSANPGNSYYYGTSSTGTKGWFERRLDTLADVDTTTPPVSGDALVFDGSAWAPSVVDSAVPYVVSDGQAYTVRENKQALFALPIDLEGTGTLVLDGALVEVG